MLTPAPELSELPSFFAPGAFALVRPDHCGIGYDTDLLAQAADFMRQEAGLDFPEDPTAASYVYRFGEAGFERPHPDPNFSRANPASPYIPAGQLALGVAMRPRTVTKGDILAEKRPIVQVQMASDLRVPLIRALASSLVYPPAEDHRMWASPAAWARQVKTALHLGSSGEGTNRRIVEEAAGRFAGAIVLLPRR